MGQTVATGRWIFWIAAAAAFLVLLWLLNDILLPFVVGMVVAYFLDPVVARLQRAYVAAMATTLVTIVAVLVSDRCGDGDPAAPLRADTVADRQCT